MEGLEAPPGYTVTRRLGSDASAMRLAIDDASGRPVTLRFVGAIPDGVRDRLIAAASALRAVDHLHVLPFLDVVQSPSGPVVVFGAAEGGSLAGILGARGRLPAGEVVTACAPVAEGLAEVHRRGLVHGDLTLDDIVFSLDGRPMVAGIGLVQVGVPLRVGQYARPVPPEVEAGSPPGPPADVYGLATAAMVALSGHLPSAQVALPGVAPGAEALLVAGLDPNPQRRPPAANLGNAFFALADPVPVELVLEEDHATTTGSLPRVAPMPLDEDEDVAAYMRRSTSMGRRARRRAEAGPRQAQDVPAADAAATPDAAVAGSDDMPVTDEPSHSRGRSGRRRRSGREADAPTEPARRSRRAADADADAPARGSRSGRRSADAGDTPEGGRSGRRDGLWIVSALVAILLVAGAVLVGRQMFGDDSRSGPVTGSSPSDSNASTDLCGEPQPAPSVQPAEVSDWTQEVQRLYSLRAQAFEESNPELLCQVHAPSNPVLADDAALLEEYQEAGVHTEGLTFEVVNAELVSQEAGTVTLTITQRIPEYQLVNADGEVEETFEGTDDETWEAELVAVADEGGETASWRFG